MTEVISSLQNTSNNNNQQYFDLDAIGYIELQDAVMNNTPSSIKYD
jgi:hypothetical protein